MWSFASLLTISFFAMVMITLRSAWLEVTQSRSRMSDEVPIISVEKIQDLQNSQFDSSPSPKGRQSFDEDNRRDTHFTDPDSSSREQSRDRSLKLQQEEEGQEQALNDPVTLYESISVADEGLREIPSSPKDPPGYRVY